MKNKWLYAVPLTTVLSGCTTLSKDECMNAHWQQIGYAHGTNGKEYNDGLKTIAKCTEYGINADLAQYKTGYDQGLALFCEPENGFTLGLKGSSYNGVCNSIAFRKAWQEGNDRYEVQQRISYIDSRIERIDRRLEDIRAELTGDQLDSTQRKALYNEREYLEDERTDLRKERALLPLLNTLPSVEVSTKW